MYGLNCQHTIWNIWTELSTKYMDYMVYHWIVNQQYGTYGLNWQPVGHQSRGMSKKLFSDQLVADSLDIVPTRWRNQHFDEKVPTSQTCRIKSDSRTQKILAQVRANQCVRKQQWFLTILITHAAPIAAAAAAVKLTWSQLWHIVTQFRPRSPVAKSQFTSIVCKDCNL